MSKEPKVPDDTAYDNLLVTIQDLRLEFVTVLRTRGWAPEFRQALSERVAKLQAWELDVLNWKAG